MKKQHKIRLNTWKEISDYLNCTVRTCRRWEKQYNLPVYRLNKAAGSRVYAYKDDIDEWLLKSFRKKQSYNRTGLKSKKFIFPVVVLLVVVWSVFILMPKVPKPYDFKIEDSNLIILDEGQKILWEYDFKINNLIEEQEYRKFYQTKSISDVESQRLYPQIMIKDINSDNKKEVLFSLQTKDDFNEGILFCFDYTGKILWKFYTGKELKFGNKIYSADYRIKGFDILDVNEDGIFEVLIIANHCYDFPTQLIILDYNGRKLSEYWNAGRLTDYLYIDFDQDGEKEFIISGMNNEYKKGCLIVFQSSNIQGSSPQLTDTYICKNLKPGSHKYYILFPRTQVAEIKWEMDAIGLIQCLSNGWLRLIYQLSGLIYELDSNFTIRNLTINHLNKEIHREAFLKGLVAEPLNENYAEKLKKQVLYWNGKKWVSNAAFCE